MFSGCFFCNTGCFVGPLLWLCSLVLVLGLKLRGLPLVFGVFEFVLVFDGFEQMSGLKETFESLRFFIGALERRFFFSNYIMGFQWF